MAAITSGEGILDVDTDLCAPEQKDIGELLTDYMVDIFVGAERKKFHLHRDLLCDRSDYFKACFEGTFKEAQQKELSLPDDEVDSFGIFVGWLYGGSMKSISSYEKLRAYFALYVLTNKLCLEHLQNETMNHILRFHRTHPVSIDYQTLRYIYQNTFEADGIRQYSVAIAAWTAVSKQVVGLPTCCSHVVRKGGDLAVDFANMCLKYEINTRGNLQAMSAKDPRRFPNCHYHKHNSTRTCGEPSK